MKLRLPIFSCPPEDRQEVALAYAARGWPIFPVTVAKKPLTPHGLTDATLDRAQIRDWLKRWPDALMAAATGRQSCLVALDVDIRPGIDGRDSLETLGICWHPSTMTSHSPSGGFHCFFKWPGKPVRTSASRLGPGLDVRGDGGSLTLPPGPGRFWDPHLGLDTPLAEMPDWMVIPEPEQTGTAAPHLPGPSERLTAYNEAALDNAYHRIMEAPNGAQRQTLNTEAFGIARLVAGNGLAAKLALDALDYAASLMTSHDARRPWRPADTARIIREGFNDGLRSPWSPS